jgi:hypothetical protein
MTTPLRLADRISALVGSVDLSGFTPFFAPVMFFFNEDLWPTWLGLTCRDLPHDFRHGRLAPGCMIGQQSDRMIRTPTDPSRTCRLKQRGPASNTNSWRRTPSPPKPRTANLSDWPHRSNSPKPNPIEEDPIQVVRGSSKPQWTNS